MAKRPDSILMPVGAALIGVVSAAASTGLLVPDAMAQVSTPAAKRRDEQPEGNDTLLIVAPGEQGATLIAGHRSHSSHRSHYSGSGHYSGGGRARTPRYYEPAPTYVPAPEPPPAPPKPARVSIVAIPGGEIFVDGKDVGRDVTGTLKLSPGKHSVRIENRFLGTAEVEILLSEGQTGEVKVEW